MSYNNHSNANRTSLNLKNESGNVDSKYLNSYDNSSINTTKRLNHDDVDLGIDARPSVSRFNNGQSYDKKGNVDKLSIGGYRS